MPAPLGPLGGRFRVLEPPPGAGQGPFPVVYFLHDYWAGDAVLWEKGVAPRLRLQQANGELPAFLLVAPDGDRGFWADSWDGRHRYQQWLTEELPAQVAARWPVRAGRASRAYVGISMGGLGAVNAALRRPRETAAVVAISGLLVPLDRSFVRDANPLIRRALTGVFGPGPDDAALRAADAYLLLDALDGAPAPRPGEARAGERPDLLLLAGTEDKYRLDEAAERFADRAPAKGIVTELRLTPGGHDWGYWREAAEAGIVWAVHRLDAAASDEGTMEQ